MMSPADKEKFQNMVNEGKFTQKDYDKLLKRFDLENVDLESEYTKIVKKVSYLSRRHRDLIPDFLDVKDMLDEKAKADAEKTKIETTVQENKTSEKTE